MMGSKKCGKCGKSIYHNDPQLAIGGKHFHKSCARCEVCNGYLSIKNYSTSGDRLLCKTHFKEEFSSGGGKYAGDEKFKQSASRSFDITSVASGDSTAVASLKAEPEKTTEPDTKKATAVSEESETPAESADESQKEDQASEASEDGENSTGEETEEKAVGNEISVEG